MPNLAAFHPGLRTGDPQDVRRLLLAGLYTQSQADRKAGRLADAASLVDVSLVDVMTARWPATRRCACCTPSRCCAIAASPRNPRLEAKLDSIR